MMEQESANYLFANEFGLSPMFEEEEGEDENQEEENLFVSDANFAEYLQLQECVMASVIVPPFEVIGTSTSQRSSADDFGLVALFAEEEMESSLITLCDICTDEKEDKEMSSIEGCLHSFCVDCISKHVAAKLEDNISSITCPGLNCNSILEIETFRPLLPKIVLDLWEESLCNSLVAALRTFYCPFKDCSAMLLNDNKEEIVRESECPYCHRLFCAECNVPWHPGVDCEEYQRLNEDEKGRDDLMVRELAKEKKWGRCPQCKYYVERTGGCPHMTCRCQFQFCYGCGSGWNGNHAGCSRD